MSNKKSKTKNSIFMGLTPAMTHPPDDIEHLSGFFNTRDGSDLFWHSWSQKNPKSCVIIAHGFGEYVARYHHFAAALARSGFAVFGFDFRGHGRSSGKRAFIQSFSDYLHDLEDGVTEAADHFPGLSQHIFGHSNGGLIAAHHASTTVQSKDIVSYGITSPFFGFKLEVPAIKALAGKALSSLIPSFRLPTELDAKWISRDERVVEAYREDPLVLKVATARWFTETQKAQAELLSIVGDFTKPNLWLVAGADEIADPEASQQVFDAARAEEKELKLLPEHYHEVLNELDWEEQTKVLIDHFEKYS